MHRRNFLKTSSLAGLTLTTMATAACHTSPAGDNNAAGAAQSDDFELNEVTIDALQQKMASKACTSRSITELYLKRIGAIDKSGPRLNSVIELNPDALSIADAMEHMKSIGAEISENPHEVGEGIKVGSVKDPFGNIVGIIENPMFDPTTTT